MKSTYINGYCYYPGEDGILLPAVSAILKATESPHSLAALCNWRKKVGKDEANRITANSRRRGKDLHQLIQAYLQGKPIEADDMMLPYWYSVQSVLEQLSDIKLVEEVVPNYQEGYAGKVDCVARYNGIPHTIEWTTSEEPKQEKYLTRKCLQVVAHGGAANRYYGESLFGSRIKRGLIVVALPEKNAQTIQLDREKVIDYWKEWRQKLDLFHQAVA